MEFIRLLSIKKEQNRIEYAFTVSEGLSGFFSGKPFVIEYPESIEAVPDGIAAVPFAGSVIPLIWVSGAVLELPELDKAFYDCLPQLKKGYEVMYPETAFSGTVQVGRVVPCDRKSTGGCAAYFSGGLDSVQTLIRHLDEKPELISIWGSDVNFDNEAGWALVSKPLKEYARKFDLRDVTIRSAFRSFDMEWEMDKVYEKQLQENWWLGMKHGIALLSHAAPYAYLNGLSTIYIASSFSEEDGAMRCASAPTLDNHVRFAECQVIHDGYELTRQDKVHNIVVYRQQTGNEIPLHVCWESQKGSNCCECEKCYRTMAGLLVEGEDPVPYGFEESPETLGKMKRVLVGEKRITASAAQLWVEIQRAMQQNRELLQTKPYWRYIKWMEKADFAHPENLRLSAAYRLRVWLSQFPVLQAIYNLRKLF